VKVLLTKNLSKISKNQKCKIVNDTSLRKADLIIVIGGDGSILGVAREYSPLGVPLLGINLGNIGFLADIPPESITTTLTEIICGKFIKDKRFLLEASINKEKNSYNALNEIVIHSGAVAQLIEYELFIDGVFVYRQRADGIIINSPTGSTAYSLSGGGPIIHPSVNAITLLPMFPHSLSTSPLLVNDNSAIEIRMVGSKNKSTLSLDSHNLVKLKKGDVISIKKTDYELTLVHPIGHDFFASCRNKLGWSSVIKSS
jgi:NAD+ kinase